jgi:hypothetical protein
MTFADIRRLVPCMSATAVRNGLAKGRTTRRELLSADCRQDRRATRKMQFGRALRQ